MSKHDPTELLGSAYATGELAASLRAAATHTDPELRARAEARSKSWLSVLANLASGALQIGQRAPYAGVPTWVTPEVVRGGFASGEHAAGGAPRSDEIALAQELGVWPTRSRTALNGHHLTARGSAALASLLSTRTYRIEVPEEGALLAVRWLIDRGDLESAASLLETIEPFFDRLRFYPRVSTEPLKESVVGIEMPVLARPAHALAKTFANKTPSPDVETMREALEVWAPLTDALVSLVLETMTDDGVWSSTNEDVARGAMPFTHDAASWRERRLTLLDRIAVAARAHTRCKRVHRPNEVFGMLRAALEAWPDVSRGDRARVWHRLEGFVAAYGVPGSVRHRALRASQVVGPSHAVIAHVLSARLTHATGPGEGLSSEDARAIVSPITASEALASVRAGTEIPKHLAARVQTTEEAPLATHVARGVVRSGEVLATLLPQLTGPALATRFDDARARALYVACYRAFRQRRSLLLLWLQHQVRFGELPWIAALEASADRDPRAAVEETLAQLAAFAIESFPGTITPNKLVSELSALAAVARPPSGEANERPWLPLVEEIAADIFMGTFSIKFLRAAQVAATSLGNGSLYARYYGLDLDRVLAMENVVEQWSVKTCPDFDAYCLELADLPAGGNPRARSGAMIEQASILTTHNLAVLCWLVRGTSGPSSSPSLARRRLLLAPAPGGASLPRRNAPPSAETELAGECWAALAEAALGSALDRLERRVLRESVPRIQRMRASKTLAFAWRQMLFFASRLDAAALAAFVSKAEDDLASRTPLARERFAPVMEGLRVVARGERLTKATPHARRLLGWSVGTPFLMGS